MSSSRSKVPTENAVEVYPHPELKDKWLARAHFAFECTVMARDADGTNCVYDSELEAWRDVTRRFMWVLNSRQTVTPKQWARADDMIRYLERKSRKQGYNNMLDKVFGRG